MISMLYAFTKLLGECEVQ